ncbi:hypothetical protein K3F96_06440 [Acinetobacter baumannii]|uniref:hypothetical protein n=1 Tax=Acinetobacter baumannii TaxID=470 RepID=UPI00189A5952|nr:hypothetical protein [Acinetobacter baumannii]MBF6745469.1 hypothetical protein [Acinetobacter baumannii]MBF6831572.1 hypothetical protein [Acinetobacter baumannii]MBF6839090.1 hypothetical protein [Acinetobacter baumannii]MBF6929442.1 hypothetical protein [Acinetobacter baumannii]MDC3924719.1 hypothetical protein [Acinetobacter baumannii]
MPKVKFLVDLCSGTAGTEVDVQEYEANLLLQLGVAELIDDFVLEQVKAESPNENSPEKILGLIIQPEGVLLNLNGTPVVDDFGSFVPNAPQNPIETAPKVVKFTSKTGKKGA